MGAVARSVLAALALASVLGVAFHDVLFLGRTLSVASYLPGVLPTGPAARLDPPRPSRIRDHEGAAWVNEPSPRVIHRIWRAGAVPLWNENEGLGLPLAGNPNAVATIETGMSYAPAFCIPSFSA